MSRSTRKGMLRPPTPPGPTRGDSKQIVDAVLAAVATLPVDTPLKSIAERAGVGVASLHRYFPSRASIYAELSRRMQRDFVNVLRETLATPEATPLSVADSLCHFAVSVPRPLRAVLNLDVPFSWTEDNAATSFTVAIDELTGWLSTRILPPPENLRHQVFAAFSCVRGLVIYSTMMPDGSLDDGALIELIRRSMHAHLPLSAPAASGAQMESA